MRYVTCLLLLLNTLIGSAQTPARAQLVGTWIGVHYAWDDDFFVPLGSYLRFDTDSTYTLGAVNEQEPPIRSRWSVVNDDVRLDTNQFKAGSLYIDGKLLRINGYFPLTFRRFADVPIALDLVRKTLTNRVWQFGAQRLHLHDNGQACREDSTASGERTVHRWSLATHQNSVFLIIKGVQDDSAGNYQPLLQLTGLGPNSFKAIGWNGETVSELTFQSTATLPPGRPCAPVGFQPCVTYLYRPVSMYYQYGQKGHSERLYFIRDLFSKSYKPIRAVGQSGLIRVRFQVNCRGEAGRFEFLELDDTYQQRPFDHRITEQIRAIFAQSLAMGWLPVKQSQEGYNSDYVQFVTLRLKDGIITEIFP